MPETPLEPRSRNGQISLKVLQFKFNIDFQGSSGPSEPPAFHIIHMEKSHLERTINERQHKDSQIASGRVLDGVAQVYETDSARQRNDTRF